jgi:hypothetical protein
MILKAYESAKVLETAIVVNDGKGKNEHDSKVKASAGAAPQTCH